MRYYLRNWSINNLPTYFNQRVLTALALFLSAAFILSINSSKPFYGEHDWNGARYGNIARNYLRYGLLGTKFAQIENSGMVQKNEGFQYFTHYPPTFTLLIAFCYLIFGISEQSTRMVPIIATSGIVSLIFLIGEKIKNYQLGLLGAVLIMPTPIFLYFGKTPFHESLVVFFSLGAYYCYLNFASFKFRVLFYVLVVLAELTTWTGFFLISALIFSALIRKDFKELKQLIPAVIISIVVFLLYIFLVYFWTGSFLGGDLLGVFLQRSGVSPAGKIANLNPLTYLLRIRLWLSTLYSIILLGLTIVWAISKKYDGMKLFDWQLVSLGIFGAIYLIVFPNASFIHNYLVFYLLPFLTLSAGSGLIYLTRSKVLSRYFLLLVIAVVISIFVERYLFLTALNSSNGDKLAVEVGKSINLKTKITDRVLVIPAKFGDSADNFLKFYSDRRIIYSKGDENVRVEVDEADRSFIITHL